MEVSSSFGVELLFAPNNMIIIMARESIGIIVSKVIVSKPVEQLMTGR